MTTEQNGTEQKLAEQLEERLMGNLIRVMTCEEARRVVVKLATQDGAYNPSTKSTFELRRVTSLALSLMTRRANYEVYVEPYENLGHTISVAGAKGNPHFTPFHKGIEPKRFNYPKRKPFNPDRIIP